jgi:hypothetical protein
LPEPRKEISVNFCGHWPRRDVYLSFSALPAKLNGASKVSPSPTAATDDDNDADIQAADVAAGLAHPILHVWPTIGW